jgi:hypothetical protein
MIPTRKVKRFLIVLSLLLTLGLLSTWTTRGQAQCGDTPADSSCKTCHDQSDPVYGRGEWHDIHARKDCCWNCHGGNTQAQDKDLAHEGMTANPLEDVYTDCYACHPEDYQARAERFGAVLGVNPSSSEPPSKPEPPQSGSQEELQLIILPTPEPATFSIVPWHPEIGLAFLVCLAVLAFFVIERRRVQG